MPLPLSNAPWPPKDQEDKYLKMAEWAAWYSGEPSRLIDYYAVSSPNAVPRNPGRAFYNPWSRFWSRALDAYNGGQKALVHVPIASDLAAISAALLFGEAPRIRYKDAHENEQLQNQQTPDHMAQDSPGLPGQGPQPARMGPTLPASQQPSATKDPVKPGFLQPAKQQPPGVPNNPAMTPPGVNPNDPQKIPLQKAKAPETPAQKAEARLLELIEEGEVFARLIEAAETAAAIGGAYIYPAFDKKLADFPFIAVAQADMAIPTFRFGFLVEVIFHRVVRKDGDTVWRHLEWHYTEGEGDSRKCKIENALYRGSDENLGQRVGIKSISETAEILPEITMPFSELDVEYVPNMRPNRLWRASGLGVADIQGSETLLDAIDETYASWMRDIRLAKARIIVPSEYIEYTRDDSGNVKAEFDVDREIYTPMEIAPNMEATATSQMMAHQFAIRWNEHQATADNFIRRVVSNAGYSPTTFGEQDTTAGGVTAAGLRVTEHKTILTQRRRAARWRAAIERVLRHLMLLDLEEFDSGLDQKLLEELRPTVEMSDGIIDNPLELAQTALAMMTAQASSIETRVRLLHPTWTEAEIASEVERVKGEIAAAKPAPTVMPPAFGNPKADPQGTHNFPTTDPRPGQPPQNPPPQNGPPLPPRP